MAISPQEVGRRFELTGRPPEPIVAAGIQLVSIAMRRLRKEGELVAEEDGSLSRVLTLESPEAHRVRRLKLTNIVKIGDFEFLTRLSEKGLLVAGYQLDEFGLFQGYLSSLRLPKFTTDKSGLLHLSGMNPIALRATAKEIQNARRAYPYMFDQYREANPYLGINI